MEKLEYQTYCEYLEFDGDKLFTIVQLPKADGKFPTVIMRCPYNNSDSDLTNEKIMSYSVDAAEIFLKNGYALVYQHCRGTGKSTGEFIPYVNERKDSRFLYEWVRGRSFYNGEIFLTGSSYFSYVHYAAAPFDDDIKGAVFNVKDSVRYNAFYRNGVFKTGHHGDWYAGMYKIKNISYRAFANVNSYNLLPLSDFSKTVFGESAIHFDEILKHPLPTDEFWNTEENGGDIREVLNNINIPILLTTGFYDIYTGGIFKMWKNMTLKTRKKSALIVTPYDHGDNYNDGCIKFPKGKKVEQFGDDYVIKWFDYIRGKCDAPFDVGCVTYYRLFENRWETGEFVPGKTNLTMSIGKGKVTYTYNPYDPPSFKGGLSCNFGGTDYQDAPNSRYDIISCYTDEFDRDVFVKGKMAMILSVSSDCEDTGFYVRISIAKDGGDFGLRDDITSLSYQHFNYVPNEKVKLDFSFDEHAFLIRKGEKLRIDISSADSAHYVRHTNQKGLFSEQRTAKVAHNSVFLDESELILPIE